MNSYSNNETESVPHLSDVAKVETVKRDMVDDYTAEQLADVFKIIGDATRVKIIYALLQAELCVNDLSAIVGLSQSAVSHQLRTLRNSKLVKCRRVGQMILYSLDDHHIINLLSECLDHIQE